MNLYNFEEPHYECYNCQHKDNQLDDIKYWLLAINEHLYGQNELNEDLLEHCLTELAHIVGIKFSDQPLNIKRKQTTIVHLLDEWKEANNQYLKTVGVPQ